jgi:hypothetical protein
MYLIKGDMMYLQGADDKLGQFFDQDIEALDNHRNVLRYSLESCPSLVSPNLNKHQYLQKCIGRVQYLYSSPKSFACRKKSTGDCKVSKSAQVPGLPFEECFEPKPGCWGGRCHSCPKLTHKRFFWPHMDSRFCGLATQNTAKITQDWLKANL